MATRRCMAVILSAMLLAGAAVSPVHAQTEDDIQTGAQNSAQTGAQDGVQNGNPGESLSALRKGQLTVWFVGAPSHPPETALQAVAALHNATPLTYQERSAGNFGQSSSTYGQSSSAYGVDADSRAISTPTIPPGQSATSATPNGIGYKEQGAGSFGQSSSTYGQDASNYGTSGNGSGQNGGSFSQDPSSYGEDASKAGQDVSTFGNSTGTIANAANNVPKPPSDPAAEDFKAKLQQVFPDLQLRFTEVAGDELKDRLLDTRGTPSYPDVLVGDLPRSWWQSMQSQFGVAMLTPANFYPNGVSERPPHTPLVAILARAPHMAAAQAFALWMSEPAAGCPGCVQSGLTKQEQAAATTATTAVEHILDGEPLGNEADPQMAASSSMGVRRMLAIIGSTNGGVSLEDATPRIEVEHASVDGSLAAVALRVVVSSSRVFGVAHPLVVLRAANNGATKNGATTIGPWKVLQVSMNLEQVEQQNVRRTLMETAPTSAAEQRAGVKGVSLAAPVDDDSVRPLPDLVWDNNGGAGLQVVEWQRNENHGWSSTRLYLVQDRSPRLQTHVVAEFARRPGEYHWRVWSVGAHGEMKISPWRTFQVSP